MVKHTINNIRYTQDPTATLAFMLQVKDRIKGLQDNLATDLTMPETLKQKKRDWITSYSNLVEQLEYKYFELTNKLN